MEEDLMHDIKCVLIDKEQIRKKCEELGKKISSDYCGKKPLFVCVLKGSVMFYADLLRNINIDCELEFMAISSYGTGKSSSGEVKVVKDLNTKVEGRDIIIVEDIVDTGITLMYLVNLLKCRGASSVEICALLDKIERREREVYPKYKGFVIPNEFVVGYGLDFNEKYRNLPEVCILNS